MDSYALGVKLAPAAANLLIITFIGSVGDSLLITKSIKVPIRKVITTEIKLLITYLAMFSTP